MIENSRVVVTGAGGSIGGELTQQIAALGPAEVILIDNSEYNLYAIDLELAEKFPGVSRKPYICDVRDAVRLGEIFQRHSIDLVFHAAALKHVPMVELNPCEGILTNVIGTMNVAEATRLCGAKAMVQISTDKVVNTTNVMGATKRLGGTLLPVPGPRFCRQRYPCPLHDRSFRQCSGFKRVADPAVQAPARPWRSADRDRYGDEALLHDDQGGG